MDPVSAGIGVAAAALPKLFEGIGWLLSQGDRDAADQLLNQAAEELNIPVPELQQMYLKESQLGKIKMDPAMRAAQTQAIDAYGRVADQGGQDIEYRAAMDSAQNAANQQAASQDANIRQDMAIHGMGGTGVEYLTRAQAGQNAANRLSSAGFDAAAEGRRRAIDAYGRRADLAERVESNDWDRAAQVASANDRIGQWNATVPGQRFGMQFGLGKAKSNVAANRANIKTGQAAQTQEQGREVGAIVGAGVGRIGQEMVRDQNDRDWNAFEEWRRKQATSAETGRAW